ncbi:hypothetical protein REPUB_Repub14bG0074400 [Reevesia pubescens]
MQFIGRKDQKMIKEKTSKLRDVFQAYANHGGLGKDQLKNAFEHLGAYMPYKQAEEALSVADKNGDYFVSSNTEEFDYLVEYAYTKGFGDSI